jgi:hypothetical protein
VTEELRTIINLKKENYQVRTTEPHVCPIFLIHREENTAAVLGLEDNEMASLKSVKGHY